MNGRRGHVMRYRKKPVEIEAMRVPAKGADELRAVAEWCNGTIVASNGAAIAIDTLEGTMTAEPGDFVVCGVAGEFYPVKPDIFEATYEPLTDARETR